MVFLFRRMEAGSPKPPGKATKKTLELPKGLRKNGKSYQNNNDTIKAYFTYMLLSLAWK